MKQVRIADLKAHLSQHLRAVQQGESIAILDRDTPIAQIVPVKEAGSLRSRGPVPGAPPLNRVPLPKKRLGRAVDIVDLLLEERRERLA